MKREEFEAHLQANGWKKDAHGHYHKGEYRFHMRDRTVSFQNSYGKPKRWLPIDTQYYSKITANARIYKFAVIYPVTSLDTNAATALI